MVAGGQGAAHHADHWECACKGVQPLHAPRRRRCGCRSWGRAAAPPAARSPGSGTPPPCPARAVHGCSATASDAEGMRCMETRQMCDLQAIEHSPSPAQAAHERLGAPPVDGSTTCLKQNGTNKMPVPLHHWEPWVMTLMCYTSNWCCQQATETSLCGR